MNRGGDLQNRRIIYLGKSNACVWKFSCHFILSFLIFRCALALATPTVKERSNHRPVRDSCNEPAAKKARDDAEGDFEIIHRGDGEGAQHAGGENETPCGGSCGDGSRHAPSQRLSDGASAQLERLIDQGWVYPHRGGGGDSGGGGEQEPRQGQAQAGAVGAPVAQVGGGQEDGGSGDAANVAPERDHQDHGERGRDYYRRITLLDARRGGNASQQRAGEIQVIIPFCFLYFIFGKICF